MSADDPWDRRSSRMVGGFPATGGWSRKGKVSISGGLTFQSTEGKGCNQPKGKVTISRWLSVFYIPVSLHSG